MTIEEKIAKYKPVDWVAELMRKTGKSDITIYKTAKKLGRRPTEQDVLNTKRGRPTKY